MLHHRLNPAAYQRAVNLSEYFDAESALGAGFFDELCADLIDFVEISPHPFEHNLLVDIHHVSMANFFPIHDVDHLSAAGQLAVLRFDCQYTYLGLLQIVQYGGGHVRRRSGHQVFEHKYIVR